MATKIQLRRDNAANWQATNPVLSLGEPGVETDTHNMKVGDGVTAWNNLAYTAKDGGLTPVFVSMDDYYSQIPRISEDGVNWTAEANTGSPGTAHSSDWYTSSIAIGNGVIVYRAYNYLTNKDELRYSDGPYQAAVRPVSDITRLGPNGEGLNWETLTFGGGYFVAGGWYYDTDRNNIRYPIAAYSADGATWTMINIDLNYVKGIVDAQNNAHANTASGIKITNVVRGSNGWMFALRYKDDYTNSDGSNRIEPGAFYITSITTALNSSSYFATAPSINDSAWFDGHGWIGFSNTNNDYVYINTNTDPRQGTWTNIDLNSIVANLGTNYSDYYDIQEVTAGELAGVNYMVMTDYYGIVYYTADQGTTWDYVTPGPAYAGIYELEKNVNGGLRFSNSSSNVIWGDYPADEYNGEKITITGSYVAALNGTWWMDDYDGTSYPLYSDKAKLNRLNTSGFATLNIISKYVDYGYKGDNSIILPDTTNIVVGQRIYGIDAVLAKEDVDNNWKEPNIVTSVNGDTNRITLKYPLYQDFNGETLSFQALVTYTHGDQLDEIIYGGGKFVATGSNTNRAYFTTNMTDWHFTVNADDQGGFNGSRQMAYGALDINKNALRNKSATVTGITNSLTLGDTFNVNVVGMTDAPDGPYDYYGATDYNEGGINIDPSNGLWYLGTYDNARDAAVAIYSYTGYQIGPGGNVNADEYYHATSVRIETANNSFYFDDYYGTFMAEKINIGTVSDNYYDYYGYNHIDDIHFDEHDIYTSDGYELTIYNMFAPINDGGGVHIHWDNESHVRVNDNGVVLSKGGYEWQFTNDNDGVLYAPFSSDIDVGGYWTIGQGNGSVGYPYIGAVNNLDTPQSDPYDFVIQAGQSDGATVNNYWYFNRDGNFQLPDSGRIDVGFYWQLGWNNHTYIGATDNVDPDPYDVRIKVGNDGDNTYFYFNRTGTFDMPADGEIRWQSGYWKIGSVDGAYPVTIDTSGANNYDLQVRSGSYYWIFQQDGNFKLPAGGDIVDSDGYTVLNKDMPQNAVSANGNYTLALSDRGKHIYKTGTGNIQIPTNASVTFPIGTCITLVTGSDNSTHIVPDDSITTSVVLSKFGANANINVPVDTYVTILKIETDKWIVQT